MERFTAWLTDPWHLLAIYLVMNIIVFFMYGIDKAKAKGNKWRIPEKTLIISAVFGVFGALGGMSVFRHKTKKPKFVIAVPLILVIEAALVYFLHSKGIFF